MWTLANAPLLLASGDGIGVVFFSVAGVVAICTTIAWNIRKSKEAAYNARLKQMMIERGMNANEIDVVIRSEPNGKRPRGAEYARNDPQKQW